ncbi:plasma membrane calcium [Arachnomyces sp. PD_36]|nr:plasma membrane calcium [Arachnomyces sp. PD_36]
MANNNSSMLSPPTLMIPQEQSSSSSSLTTADSPSDQSPPAEPPLSRDGSFLAVGGSHAASASLDGDTLRSRANSFNSEADTVVRSRAGSNVNPELSAKADYDDVPASEALKADKRDEQDFQVENNPFAFSPGQLNKLFNPKSLAAFRALGGPNGLERGLRTDLTAGLSIDETRLEGQVSFEEATSSESTSSGKSGASPGAGHSHDQKSQFVDRIRVYKTNRLPERKTDGFFKLLWNAYNDKIIILLTIAAVVSLSLGLYETFSGGSSVDWVEGVAICVAIIIVTVVTAANDWHKERQFASLNKRKDDREVKATRSGKLQMISIFDITVGDILHLEPGDAVPADGIFVSGHGVKCDESSATGESDQMKKMTGQEVWQHMVNGTATRKMDPFIISGSKVLEGVGTFVVTSVGPNSSYGKILLSLQTPNDPTPLQVKLGNLADWIGGLGTAAAGLLFFIILFRFLANLSDNPASPSKKGSEFLDLLITAVTVIVVAIPEGLPLAVTLALAFATTRMVKENNLVRVLRACETMGNATVICSDKTGTLTQNKMTVVAGTLGLRGAFNQLLNNDDDSESTTLFQVAKGLSYSVRDLIVKGIALNSTAFPGEENGQRTFVGSKTEVAMLQLANDHLGMDVTEERGNADIVQLIPFDSARKCMGVVIREPSVGYRLFVKGAAELMLESASDTISDISDEQFTTETITGEVKDYILTTINSYAKRSLRTIGMLYKDFESWPPKGARTLEEDNTSANFEDVFHDMIWAGVVGIQDPLRPEVPAAIGRCNKAGVEVKMVTGDNMTTASAIATECGIKTPDGIAMEGPKFRQLSDDEMDRVLPKLQVLARSSPEDKRILVARLKYLGETVAVTGDGTNDGPALKTADVGFSMGIAGTEVAKEASSIILLDDNFRSIVTAISWGRAVNDAVAKFLQFQITVNITAVCLTFVSSVANGSGHSVLNAVQLLWVNLIMDTFAALALATDAPTEKILDRKPNPKSAPLFTPNMWKMIIGQAIYQLVVTFILYFAGAKILGYDVEHDKLLREQMNTIVFNTFVWMQIFNEFNNRRLDNGFNIFEGVLQNYWFMGINCLMVGGQIMIIFIGGAALGVKPLTGVQWAICIGCAIFCLPWAVLLRCIPDHRFEPVMNFTVDVISAILRPIGKAFRFVFSPIGRGFRAVWSPVQRFFSRSWNKMRGKKPAQDESDATTSDEEKADNPPAYTSSPSTTGPVPPITVTTPN